MTSIPVLLDGNHTDILNICARLRRGDGSILLSGHVSHEVEDEIQKAIRFAGDLADLGEFEFPDLSVFDLHISFTCKSSRLPVTGQSYGLGLGIEILRCFAARSWPDHFCYTGCIGRDGKCVPVEGIGAKLRAAAAAGFDRLFLPSTQLDFYNRDIRQVPVQTVYEAWSVLNYA